MGIIYALITFGIGGASPVLFIVLLYQKFYQKAEPSKIKLLSGMMSLFAIVALSIFLYLDLGLSEHGLVNREFRDFYFLVIIYLLLFCFGGVSFIIHARKNDKR